LCTAVEGIGIITGFSAIRSPANQFKNASTYYLPIAEGCLFMNMNMALYPMHIRLPGLHRIMMNPKLVFDL
jgi:hypothetical protein